MPDAPYQGTLDFDRVTFNRDLGEQKKERGQAQASLSRKQLLELAKLAAVRIARRQGTVTSDDVFAEMLREGLDPTALGPAAGCVFRGAEFEFTGRWEKSQRVSNHASDLRVWQLRGDAGVALRKDVAREEVTGREECRNF